MDLFAPSHWRTLEFHSDVHLFQSDPHTFQAWRRYLEESPADAIFILGDLFEVWVGDDALDSASPFEQACIQSLRDCTKLRPTFFLPGNRDFLVGDRLLQHVGIQRLPDPTVLIVQGTRVALSHGDVLCTDDRDYQAFRSEVRTPQWIHGFLSQPLTARQATARAIRQASELRKSEGAQYVDVTPQAVAQLLQDQHADALIHGHTHLPGEHLLEGGRRRYVLSDWCADCTPTRLEVLQLKTSPTGPVLSRRTV